MKSNKTKSLSGREFDSEQLKKDLEWVLPLEWKENVWVPKDALIDNGSGTIRFYYGQRFNNKDFELVRNGWTHDHCDICYVRIGDGDSYAESDNNIICKDCYTDFVK